MSIPTPKPLHVDFSPVLNCRGYNYIGGGGEEGDTGHNIFKSVCVGGGGGGGSHNKLELSVFKKSIIKWGGGGGGGGHNNMRGF